MADNGPPGMQAAPGQTYDNIKTESDPEQQHPHLPQLNTSNGSTGLGAIGSPAPGTITSPGGSVRRSAPEPNKHALYIGGLDQRVTEDMLKQIFETTGVVQNVKIIPDKTVSTCFCGTYCEFVHVILA